MIILIDTREQKPIKFTRWIKETLVVGDYTTVKLEGDFHIERKSPGDLYGSIIQGHMRFRRMLQRASDRLITVVVMVECSERKFFAKQWSHGKERDCSEQKLRKIIATMKRHYDLEFVWCRNRTAMKKAILQRLTKEERKQKR